MYLQDTVKHINMFIGSDSLIWTHIEKPNLTWNPFDWYNFASPTQNSLTQASLLFIVVHFSVTMCVIKKIRYSEYTALPTGFY